MLSAEAKQKWSLDTRYVASYFSQAFGEPAPVNDKRTPARNGSHSALSNLASLCSVGSRSRNASVTDLDVAGSLYGGGLSGGAESGVAAGDRTGADVSEEGSEYADWAPFCHVWDVRNLTSRCLMPVHKITRNYNSSQLHCGRLLACCQAHLTLSHGFRQSTSMHALSSVLAVCTLRQLLQSVKLTPLRTAS